MAHQAGLPIKVGNLLVAISSWIERHGKPDFVMSVERSANDRGHVSDREIHVKGPLLVTVFHLDHHSHPENLKGICLTSLHQHAHATLARVQNLELVILPFVGQDQKIDRVIGFEIGPFLDAPVRDHLSIASAFSQGLPCPSRAAILLGKPHEGS
jgi:hypothetical protein